MAPSRRDPAGPVPSTAPEVAAPGMRRLRLTLRPRTSNSWVVSVVIADQDVIMSEVASTWPGSRNRSAVRDPLARFSSAFQANDRALYCHWSPPCPVVTSTNVDLPLGIEPASDEVHVLDLAGLEPVVRPHVVVPVLPDPLHGEGCEPV